MDVNYDAIWQRSWSEITDASPVHRHITRLIVDAVRPLGVRSLVDVGCGNGANLAALQQALGLEDIWGLDVSDAALAEARTRVRGHLQRLDVLEEVPQRRFDLVLTSQVIEHIEDDRAFLRSLRGMCGRWCMVGTLQGRMRESERSIGHVRNYRPGELQEKMREAGFDIERVIEWGFPFYSPIFRTLVEFVRSDPSQRTSTASFRFTMRALYQLYRLNTARKGDVLMVLASAR